MKKYQTSPTWSINLTNNQNGIFRTMNGNSDELIAIGRVIKAGFACSRVDVTNAKYDAIVDVSGKEPQLLRIQIKGTTSSTLSFTGGERSGKQIDKKATSRKYKYTKKDCDIILGINSNNGDCYIIPIEDIQRWGETKSFTQLSEYKENWDIFLSYKKA